MKTLKNSLLIALAFWVMMIVISFLSHSIGGGEAAFMAVASEEVIEIH